MRNHILLAAAILCLLVAWMTGNFWAWAAMVIYGTIWLFQVTKAREPWQQPEPPTVRRRHGPGLVVPSEDWRDGHD